MKKILTMGLLGLALGALGQSQPAIYLTQPYIGNGLSQAQNNFQAQTNIGINGAGMSNVVVNAVTNKDIRPIALSNNLTVQAQNPNNGDGGAIWLTADTSGGGAANGGEIDITANADDINTVMKRVLISATNANLSSGSLGEVDIFAGEIVDIYGGGAGINLNTPNGFTFANGGGITNVPASGLSGQILSSSLTNVGTLWTNGIKFASTNSGLQFTNFAIFQTTNSGRGITNFINAQLAAIQTNLTAANVTTNLFINGRSQEGQDVSKISILNSSNAVNLVYSRVPATLTWTNSGSGFGIFSNTSGGLIQFNLIDNVGNIWFFKTNSPQGQWSINFVTTNAPTGDWGRISDFAMGQNAESFTLTNVPGKAIAQDGVLVFSNQIGFTVSPANVVAPSQGKFSGLSYNWFNYKIIETNQFIYAADVAGCYRPRDRSWNIWFVGLTNQTFATYPAQIYYMRSTNALDPNPTWSTPVSVLQTNPVASTWNGGQINSERVYYDSTNDILYMTLSGTTNAQGFVFGGGANQVGQVGILTNAPNSNWSNTTSYVYLNSGAPVLTYSSSVTYETNGGVYCANLIPTPLGGPITNWAMHYICNSNFGNAQCFVANSTDLINWTKGASPILTGLEELNFIPTSDNTFLASAYSFGGNLQTRLGVGYSTIFKSFDKNGTTGWFNYSYIPFTLDTNTVTSFANRSVLPAYGTYIKNPDGTFLFAYSSLQSSTISFVSAAKVVPEPSHDLIDANIVKSTLVYIGLTNNNTGASTYMQYSRPGNNFNWASGIFMDPVGGNSFLDVNQPQGDTAFWNTNYAAAFGGLVSVGDRSNNHQMVMFGAPQFFQNNVPQVAIGSHGDGNMWVEAGTLVNIRSSATYVDYTNSSVRGQSQLVIGNTAITNFVPLYGNGAGLTNVSGAGVLAPYSTTPVAVTVGASPFTFSNSTLTRLECQFSGSVAYSISKNGAAIYGSLAGDAYFQLAPTNVCVITYSVAPTLYTNQW